MPPLSTVGTTSNAQAQEDRPSNALPLRWLTAVEKGWYRERGVAVPNGAWLTCPMEEGSAKVVKYRLEDGEWDVDIAPEYHQVAGQD
jgi:hypothetical protein